ncbi:MAG: SpoIID/LytB domain-containing protein [Lentimicrobiaceae bacterium]|nr:SpoIID/LytB domain-containing protein [Lentimicrobiaceae bacterium]
MKKVRICILLLFVLCLVYRAGGMNIKVRVLADNKLKTTVVSVVSGTYSVICDNVKIFPADLSVNSAVTLTHIDGKIRLEQGLEFIGIYSNIEFIGSKYNNIFSLKPPDVSPARVYEENVSVSVLDGNLVFVNTVSLEKYVSGVVQSEILGSSDDVEFFKIQAIAARTYCLANLNRHLSHGYNLCDGVHCQSYKGRCTQADILRGTYETFNDVIVDSNNRLISTAYHSNSGGMTESAGNVWQTNVPYLQSIADTFSIGARNYEWEISIPTKQWVNYFVSNFGSKYAQSPYFEKITQFEQPYRTAKWIIDSDTILTKDIRAFFKLRSAFFSVHIKGDNVLLKGKGYGHGVGLSQEGAIQMVKLGYSYMEILRFYYQDIKIVKYTEIINL